MDDKTHDADNPFPQHPQKRVKGIVLGLSLFLIFLIFLTAALVIYTWDDGLITKGVTIFEVPVGQLSIAEATTKLEAKRVSILNRPIQFTAEGKTISLPLEALGLSCSFEKELQQAFQFSREGFITTKALQKMKASWGINFDPRYEWNDQKLEDTLNTQLSVFNVPAKDATFTITSANTMDIKPDKNGNHVDITVLMASVKKLSFMQEATLTIPFKEIQPQIRMSDLEKLKISGALSHYTTRFDANLKGRTENIRLASKALDGKLLKPNDIFSFNQTVGPRTVEAGYQEAMIIEGDAFVPGLGGGVCQVSSTLYNAVRLAGLTIIERTRHSLPVTYVPAGLDATVAYPNVDFKFKNNTDAYLLLRTRVENDTLTIYIYGKPKS